MTIWRTGRFRGANVRLDATLEDLKEHLRDIFQEITGGLIPGIRKIEELVIRFTESRAALARAPVDARPLVRGVGVVFPGAEVAERLRELRHLRRVTHLLDLVGRHIDAAQSRRFEGTRAHSGKDGGELRFHVGRVGV